MKKLIILFALLININIYALPTTYYTEYGDYNEFQEEEVKYNELTKVNVERRYKYYNDLKEYGGYYTEDSNDLNYPYIDYNDYQMAPFSTWSYTKADDAKNRIFDEKTIYEYADMKEVRYIHLYNLSGSYGAFRISEIDVHINGVEIPFTATCNNCNIYFYDFINNGKVDENMSVIYNGGSFTIDLGNYYKLDNIDFDLYLYDIGYDAKVYSIAMTRDSGLNDIIYSKATLYSYFTYDDFSDIVAFNYNINDMAIATAEYYPWVEVESSLEPSKTRLTRSYNLYRYQDVLYNYYKINRVYSDNYMIDVSDEFPFKGDEYKDYYQVSTRDKLTIEEPIIITSKDTLLNSFILDSSIDVKIENNIDYTKNGLYTVTFTIDNMVINKEVTIDIPENIAKEPIDETIDNNLEKDIDNKYNNNLAEEDIVEQGNHEELPKETIDKNLEKDLGDILPEQTNNFVGEDNIESTNKVTNKELIESSEEVTNKEIIEEINQTLTNIDEEKEVVEEPIQKKSLVAFNAGMITIILSIIMGLWIIILSLKKNSN
jgi:hypothetical protein